MVKKYSVSFTIEGEMLGDDFNLNKENLKGAIVNNFDRINCLDPFGNRSGDCDVTNLKIIKK